MFQMPLAYAMHTIALIQTLTDSDETMDEFDEKLMRFFTIIKFIIIGPFYLIVSIPANAIVFFYNLYTKAHDADKSVDEKLFTR